MPTIETFIKRMEKYGTKLQKPKPYQVAYMITSQEFLSRGGWQDLCPTLCARDYKDPKVVCVYDKRK